MDEGVSVRMRQGRVIIIVVIVLAGLLAPGVALAQGFKWWQDERMKTELSLTAEQVTKLESVFQDLLPRITAAKAELDRLESQLSSVVRDASVSESDVMRQVDVVENARSAMGRIRTLMIYRLYRGLTPEQRAKLKAMHEKWDAERRNGGRK